jgi:uncharacterized surface protein with fasciclin (FAS1) repeats
MDMLKTNSKMLVFAAVLGLAVFATSCNQEEAIAPASPAEELSKRAPAPGDKSIAEIAIAEGFNELVKALFFVDEELDAGLVNLFLNGKAQYTVFAPTDQAFFDLYDLLGVSEIDELPAELVLDVLYYHVTHGRRAANSVVPKVGKRTINTLLGVKFTVNPELEITAVGNTANIIGADVSASNGIIHVIDAVILPIEL